MKEKIIIDKAWAPVRRIYRYDNNGNILAEYKIRDGYKYKVSMYGEVKRKKDGKDWETMSCKSNRHGYVMATIQVQNIFDSGKTTVNASVHRLIAENFFPPTTKEKWMVNHKDGNKSNNYIGNLEWVTRVENTQHALKSGLLALGQYNGQSKLKDSEVHEICRLLEEDVPAREIEKRLNKPFRILKIITTIRRGEDWRHISSQYDLSKCRSRIYTKGEDRFNAVLNEDIVRSACELFSKGLSAAEIRRIVPLFKAHPGTLANIKIRKSWKDISKDYDW